MVTSGLFPPSYLAPISDFKLGLQTSFTSMRSKLRPTRMAPKLTPWVFKIALQKYISRQSRVLTLCFEMVPYPTCRNLRALAWDQ